MCTMKLFELLICITKTSGVSFNVNINIIHLVCCQLGLCEEQKYQLHQQLKDQQELNEELEFRLLELQECSEKVCMLVFAM